MEASLLQQSSTGRHCIALLPNRQSVVGPVVAAFYTSHLSLENTNFNDEVQKEQVPALFLLMSARIVSISACYFKNIPKIKNTKTNF